MFQILLAFIYLSFISLGLPDSILGAAWPVMYPQMQVPVSFAGVVSMIISAGTITSSLMSDRMTLRFGPGKITLFSVATTAIALLGFSFSTSFWMLCFWAIPYGLGAGGVDAGLNNYVALHYSSRHMSWLHCMWGVGASVGPYIMGAALTGGYGWAAGYRIISLMQIVLSAALVFSLPLWKKRTAAETQSEEKKKALSLPEILRIPGAKEITLTFLCYCSLEMLAGLWASSYLTLHHSFAEETAASLASLFYLGITGGRAISGFIAPRFGDDKMIVMGQGIIAFGIAVMLLPGTIWAAPIGLVIIGLGCAPIYPSIIHSTPAHFGEERSQALIGVQMASAYTGSCLAPPVFGMIADKIGIGLFPFILLLALVLMAVMHRRLCTMEK